MMILPSVSINLFNSKVDLAPALEEQNEPPTLGAIEKTRVRLGMVKNVFSEKCDFLPINAVSTGMPFLQAKTDGSQCFVLGDTAGTPIAVIERDGSTFNIYSTGPSGQEALARVTQDGKVLNVAMEGESEPSYSIHKIIAHPSRQFATKHVIKRKGTRVASTSYGKGNSYLLTVDAGSDSRLMTCLAAIADEVHD